VSDRHLYDYDVDPTSDTAPARVCRMVGSGKKVLEIGAGPGSITRVLKSQSNAITALELDETAIPFLEKHCDRVIPANLNDADWTSRFEDRFDAIIAADVLEHLVDPWTTLERMKTLLAPGGAIVVSVPHASHACILACLLHEDVEYRDWGLLDRTHIRFFGLQNLEAMFARAGLKIVRGEFVVRRPSDTEFKDKWEALSEEARSFLGRQRFAQVYQVVVTAARADDERPAVDLMRLDPADFGAKPLEGKLAGSLNTGINAIRSLASRVGKR
jgi:2-polyprenyl-3-methyl-5-hydroxy-6-metoxy-1,4-benzoquinol methylase